ncbi:MAG: hypothetical protein AB7S80_07265 [Rhizobiaceae bacterium]
MVAFMLRISESFGLRAKAERSQPPRAAAPREETHRIGKYVADYSELTADQMMQTDAAMDDLIARSHVVSAKRGL